MYTDHDKIATPDYRIRQEVLKRYTWADKARVTEDRVEVHSPRTGWVFVAWLRDVYAIGYKAL